MVVIDVLKIYINVSTYFHSFSLDALITSLFISKARKLKKRYSPLATENCI